MSSAAERPTWIEGDRLRSYVVLALTAFACSNVVFFARNFSNLLVIT